jgi:methylphosphotriester-DNA--protein-cysteine methyltransferase
MLDIDYHPHQGHVASPDAYRFYTPPSPLNRWVQSFWQLNAPIGCFSYHSVPDNSVDWIINLNHFEDNFVVPPFLSSIIFEFEGPVSYFGIRFRLFGQQGLMSTPLGEWCKEDDVVNAADVLPNHLLNATFESIIESTRFDERCNRLSSLLLSNVKLPSIDPRVARYVRYCYKNTASNITLCDKQCAEFGVSARHLRRLSKLYLGLLPKDFARVMRFQHTLKSLITGSKNIVWSDHYYDQPHFIREFRRLSGLTPTEFKNLSVLYNPDSET